MDNNLEDTLNNAQTIYFVCSGNIIRSSFAELLAKEVGIKNVASYGTTYHNSSIHDRSRRKLEKLGVNPNIIHNFNPTHINEVGMFDPTDIHIVMTDKHQKELVDQGISPSQIVKITNFLGQNEDVADPYFSNNYEEAYDTISRAVQQIRKSLTGNL